MQEGEVSEQKDEQRRWAVTVSYTTEATYYVDAEDEDEAEEKALDECCEECCEGDAEVVRVHQIAGPKPAPPAPLVGTLTLLDGRTLTLPCTEIRGWFRLDGGAGDWWSNGYVAVRASSVEGRVESDGKPHDVSRILPKSAEIGQPVSASTKIALGDKEYVDAIGAPGDLLLVRVDAVYWPLICDPAVGLEPRIVAPDQPVYGVRGGEIVAVAMPVRR